MQQLEMHHDLAMSTMQVTLSDQIPWYQTHITDRYAMMKSQTEWYLQGLFAVQGEGSQDVPLITDLLTASVHAGRVIVVELAGKHRTEESRV